MRVPAVGPHRITEPWGERTPYGAGDSWPERQDVQLAEGVTEDAVERWVPSASLLHSNGDAMDIAVKDGRIVGVRGRVQDRVNRGRLGPKDLFGWQANNSGDRLTRPLVRRDGELVETDWETAMDLVASRARELIDTRGPSSVGFYTTGQLFLEEYYTLGIIAHAGIGTNHVDGNTRLCTATAAEALKASFGCDGQPGSYADVHHADTIALYGHNMAETQSVLWSRVLDRLAGPNPPKLLCVDPRMTPVAREATVHLAPRPGTNLMLMNALLHEILANDWVDHAYVDAHAVGFDDVRKTVAEHPPERAAEVCDVPVDDIRAAARLLGTAERLLSTVLQGFYQSHQATASAVQVNNVHILRGMLGKPGCGVLQMNGQPTAENTREAGADGDLAGFRNWENKKHVADLAKVWNVDPMSIPHYSAPTHLMQMMRYVEDGSIRFLHVSGTNPAVSLPELARIRSILAQDRLFLVVQDLFLTETAQLADVVLPAATWGEKTGTFTNADRTVHLSEKAVEPPGEARADLEILVDLAHRLDLRDKDGEPLVKWSDPEAAFEAWKECSRGRPCDYSGLTYERLRAGGVQWPCTAERPDGTERLYEDGAFWADADTCESFGRDLVTGAPATREKYLGLNPDGKAILRACEFLPPHEEPSAEYPLTLTTGRTIYHFHTRTKTGRVPELQAAAPDVWVEMSLADADERGWSDGDLIAVTTPRGRVEAPLRVTGVRRGVVFLPFHYGYWDTPSGHEPEGDHGRAANELTMTAWDPASKQPLFKTAAAQVERVRAAADAPMSGARGGDVR
jgi:anaerobic selenocysteine-containing dehydrogenase